MSTSEKSASDAMVRTDSTIKNCGLWDYFWVTQYFSVQEYPRCWTHPFQLLIKVAKRNTNIVHFDGQEIPSEEEIESQKDFKPKHQNSHGKPSCIYTELPKSLPEKCMAPHLHKWMTLVQTDSSAMQSDFDPNHQQPRKVKVICSHGIIYRYI